MALGIEAVNISRGPIQAPTANSSAAQQAAAGIRDTVEISPQAQDAAVGIPDPPNRSTQFNLRNALGIIQARVVDKTNGETIREVPSSDRLRFVADFRQMLGQFLDRTA